MVNFEVIIWYLFLLDSSLGNLTVWFFPKFSRQFKKYKFLNKYLPATKGWMAVYLGLVLWVGYGLFRLKILPY